MTANEVGSFGEKIAAFYLEKKGYMIRYRNFRIRGGEIDIIAEKNNILAFVEVKTRTVDFFSSGLDALNLRKRQLIVKTAEQYSFKYPHELQTRFDVVDIIIDGRKVVGFNYIENAFDASNVKTIL